MDQNNNNSNFEKKEATCNASPVSALSAAEKPEHENVLAGIVGAFLFALGGGVLYFLMYQVGYIAGICGLVTVILSNLGYQVFSGKKNSRKGVIISVIMMVVVIFLAEYLCFSYDIYKAFRSVPETFPISFFDAVRLAPTYLGDRALAGAVIKDLAFSYILGAIASFSNIRAAMKAGAGDTKKNDTVSDTDSNTEQ